MKPSSGDIDGPSLSTYVETRFNLMNTSMQDAMAARDLRYQQRFDAQTAALDAALKAAKEAVNAALAAADRAVSKAELASERRFESVNEFRATLTDQQRTFIPRAEFEALLRAISDRVTLVEKHTEQGANRRGGVKDGWGYAVGVVGFILIIIAAIRQWMTP